MGFNINIDNEEAYHELTQFAKTKVASAKLCTIVSKLIHNKLQNRKYCYISNEDKEDMGSQAMIEFLLWGHNFHPKPEYSKGIAIGYLNFNMNNSFHKYITKMYQHNNNTLNIDMDVPFWDDAFNNDEEDES